MRFLIVAILASMVAAPDLAAAKPKPAKGSANLCAGFDNSYDGVWYDGNTQALLFRFAYGRDGKGCYAWLNAYAPWGIDSAGSILGPVRNKNGGIEMGGGNAPVIHIGTDGAATYTSRQGVTKGKLTR